MGLYRANQELDRRIKEQVAETARATERFHLIARATRDVVRDWDLQTNARWWSRAFQETFGDAPETLEPTIESWTSRVHPDERERVEHGIHAAIDTRAPRWFDEYQFRRADGTYAQVLDRGYVLYDSATDEPVRMVGSMTDVAERKQAEDRLREVSSESCAPLTLASR